MQRVPAGVAQSAEQPSCKRQASGSNPLTGSRSQADYLRRRIRQRSWPRTTGRLRGRHEREMTNDKREISVRGGHEPAPSTRRTAALAASR